MSDGLRPHGLLHTRLLCPNFYMHWETKNSSDSLYHNIHFIAVVWNQTYNISNISQIAYIWKHLAFDYYES